MSIYVLPPEYFMEVCLEVLREPMSGIGLPGVRIMPGSAVRFFSEVASVYLAPVHAIGWDFTVQVAFEAKFEARWGKEYVGAPYHWFEEDVPSVQIENRFANAAELRELLSRMFDEWVMGVGIVAPGREAELRDRVREFYLSIGEDLDSWS